MSAVRIRECPGLVTGTSWVETWDTSTNGECSAAVVSYCWRRWSGSVSSASDMSSSRRRRHVDNRRINCISEYVSISSISAVRIRECPGLVTGTSWVETWDTSTNGECSAAVVSYCWRRWSGSVSSASDMSSSRRSRHVDNRRINCISEYVSISSISAVRIRECPGLVTGTSWVETWDTSTNGEGCAAVVSYCWRRWSGSVSSTSDMSSSRRSRHVDNRRINGISEYVSISSISAVRIRECPGLVTGTSWVETWDTSTNGECSAAVVSYCWRRWSGSVSSTSDMSSS